MPGGHHDLPAQEDASLDVECATGVVDRVGCSLIIFFESLLAHLVGTRVSQTTSEYRRQAWTPPLL
ncbi:hypothetical protein AB0N79_34985 [Streptomyces microflavus]|uniref:hypothetical protein n=1 Tax=Streptomyces microflavus TaxID=1919 RepID=UPI003448BCF1